MLFNSIIFVVFLPLVLLAVAAVPRLRNPILLVASYIFYGWWDPRFLTLIISTTLIGYGAALAMVASADQQRRKIALTVSLVCNLGVLGTFKYFNFFVESAVQLIESIGWHASRPALDVILPVGISFYTLQVMSYVIDVYFGRMPAVRRVQDFALYVAFFPQLVAGPIERARDLLPQILSPAPVTASRFSFGLMMLMIGYTKKVLIADPIAGVTGGIFAAPEAMTAGMLLKGCYLFTLQIYCDFSGYSDIARGIGALLGIELQENFRQPYLSQSVSEFWRRWHISLGSWLRDYVYVPLGGNRGGPTRRMINVMITWLVSGLWHGANWTYVVWGGLNGIYLCIEGALGIGRSDPMRPRGVAEWTRRITRAVLTFHLVALTWIFFASPSFAHIVDYFQGLIAFDGMGDVGPLPFLAGLAVLAIDVPQNASEDHAVFLRAPWWLQSPVYAALLLGMILFGESDTPFIYFQF